MMTKINTESILKYTEFMKDRFPNIKSRFFVDGNGNLVMETENENCNINVTIEFNEESAIFRIMIDDDTTIEKEAIRPSVFNGAVIEFMTKDKDYFYYLISQIKEYPNMYKSYNLC